MTNETETVRAEPVAWDYCPECGCEKTDGGFLGSKFCADCGQEWFPDLDYTSVVRIHLSNRKSSASEIARLTGEVSRLQKSLDQLTGMTFSERMHAALVSRAGAAERRVARLEIDAGRYHELKNGRRDPFGTDFIVKQFSRSFGEEEPISWHDLERELDKAIERKKRSLTQPEADHG
jgi:hypothetical protein